MTFDMTMDNASGSAQTLRGRQFMFERRVRPCIGITERTVEVAAESKGVPKAADLVSAVMPEQSGH